MSIILVFVVVVVSTSLWYLWRNDITEKSWINDGPETAALRPLPNADNDPTTKRIALLIFLTVVTSMFCLFISAYFMRMELEDWQPLKDPELLWLNTFCLMLASISIQWASRNSGQNKSASVRMGLIATGIFSITFIGGQLWAWQQLIDQGYYLPSNPALAFFYLFTGIHGLHILGGLLVWCRTTLRAFSDSDLNNTNASIHLCRTYWHYLLLVWLVLFALLLTT
jgi:cytochrome c oxidase subunit 3